MILKSSLVIIAHALSFATAISSGDTKSHLEQFNYCMRQTQHPRLRECVGRSAISFLQRFEERDNFTISNDLISSKDDKAAGRSLINILDTDPVDFRGILENAGAVFSQRNLEWHMDAVYPGLMFKVGPTADANSVAEFVLDTALDERHFSTEEPSTARLLTKQYLVPFLLGLKFNLVALVPLLFAAICLLLKKSLFLAKLAIYVSSLLGVGGAVGALGGFSSIFAPLAHTLPHTPLHHPQVHAPNAYFPNKASVFSQYSDAGDEFHHNSPYKRHDRKISYEKPREYVGARSTPPTYIPTTAATDRFYDYEKQVMLQDRSGKLRTVEGSGKLGPSAFDSDNEPAIVRSFHAASDDRLGWKVVDLRPS